MRIAVIAVFLFFLSATVSAAEEESVNLGSVGDVKVGRGKMEVHIQVVALPFSSPCSNLNIWWGSEKRCPSRKIGRLELLYMGKRAIIPYSAISALSEPNKLVLREDMEGDVYNIIIQGGDAAESYECLLKVEKGILISRRVWSREFPQRAWEETLYRFNREEGN